jgi:aspartate aminotransferase
MQVTRLKEEFGIYCTEDGRFSMAGINSHNVDYLAKSVAAVTK